MQHPIKVIITGATGMVGEGVLQVCLQSDAIAKVLLINRRPSGITHLKVTEIVHEDFMDVNPLKTAVSGYDACFFCIGVSSVGMKEAAYYRFKYELTIGFARLLSSQNPVMTFCYVFGVGTDSSEKGRLMWARVKGKTENALMQLPFNAVFLFRPAIIIPTPGLKNTLKLYHYFGWLIPLFKVLIPNSICSLKEMGEAMIQVALTGNEKKRLEVKDIKQLQVAFNKCCY
ncbi:NAD-dependent epimerase/dehydratase family protein [Hydrotalea sp.]|uniref:NAD-dependent epimerase/dehydratase family protein n=1 Tax=Hydrotalea sp. TaxID=2881279 RepID=UPI00221D7380|nr:NAD-dependent epimerase/dehydratase family protein [Hydrotalea sp.]GHT92798.1 epimerase [Spirochaetia bacterium]